MQRNKYRFSSHVIHVKGTATTDGGPMITATWRRPKEAGRSWSHLVTVGNTWSLL